MANRSEQAVADEIFSSADPLALFSSWLTEAEATEPNDANAMSVATVDGEGLPNVRILLLKHADEDGFVFYTNTQSAKGVELLGAGKAALNFYWKTLRRQVRVRGAVSPVSAAEADAYFATRPRGSQLGAWASAQSRPLESRDALIEAVGELEKQYDGKDVPRPPHWSGFRVVPQEMEFWINREFRLHDRRVFLRGDVNSQWQTARLSP